MAIKYSPGTGGFYDTDLNKNIPPDAVEIGEARRAEMLAAQAAGARIVPHPETGQPVAETESADALRARTLRSIKREAERRILSVSPLWRQINDQRDPGEGTEARFAAIDAIRAASDAIEALLAETADADLPVFPVVNSPLWPEFEDPA